MTEGAHSKMVLRLHGMEEVGVRFPMGPQKNNPRVGLFFVAYMEESNAGAKIFSRKFS